MKKLISKSYIFYIVAIILLINIFGTYSYFVNSKSSEEASRFNKIDSANANVNSGKLIPLGTNFGIKIYSEGVIVSSIEDININGASFCPAKDAGIKAGDTILAINGKSIQSNEDFTQLLTEIINEKIILKIQRQKEIFETEIKPIFDGTSNKLGMWIRDSAGGIGTLTFYNPETKIFAGLGHGICDVDSGTLINLKNGKPYDVDISSVQKGQPDNPGKICGYFSSNTPIGLIYKNTDTGIFGTLKEEPTGEAYNVAKKEEIKRGNAQIIATLENNKTEFYDVEIEKICNFNSKVKNFIIKITDQDLIEISGGIVQGMSGSPVIQNGKIIGAVTHVFINDPTRGYGIFIENMLETAKSIE